MLYTIGEMAKKINVATSTLRYYDKEGLLPFVERSGGGIRMFSDKDFEWLSIIECLKKADVSIKDIKVFIDLCMEGDSTIQRRLDLINHQRESVLAQIEQMQETLLTLEYKCWYYEAAQAAGTCAIHECLQPEDIPEKFHEIRNKTKGLLI